MQGRLSSHILLRTPTMEHRNRRGERLDRWTMTLHSTLLPPTAIPRSLFTTPYLTSACSHRREVYEWEDPYFYTMLVQEWETTSAWTGQIWQHYKAELLRVRGIAVGRRRILWTIVVRRSNRSPLRFRCSMIGVLSSMCELSLPCNQP